MAKHYTFRGVGVPSSKTILLLGGIIISFAVVSLSDKYSIFSFSSSLAKKNAVCTQDSQCGGGYMCVNETCQNAFACTPFVNATWRNPNDLLAGGAFDEARYPEYMQLVPLSGIGVRKQYALRIQGGPSGEHTYERAVLKYFTPIREVWSGSMFVNLSKLIEKPQGGGLSTVILGGGYTIADWPSGAGSWKRDFALGAVRYLIPSPGRTFGMEAYWHQSTEPAVIPGPMPPDAVRGWPDRFVQVDWYFTPSHNLFARIEGLPWVQITSVQQNVPDSYHKFRGFAAGWISSYWGGSVDIKQIKLYDSSCLPRPMPTITITPTPTKTTTPSPTPTISPTPI